MRIAFTRLPALLFGAALCFSAVSEELPTYWVPDLYESFHDEDHARVDPRVFEEMHYGDPELGKWAIRARSRVNKMSDEELVIWLRVVQQYRIPNVQDQLLNAAERLIEQADAHRGVRPRVFFALATMAEPGSEERLRALLKAEFKAPNEESRLALESHCRAGLAAALVRLDDDAGRDYLVREYKAYLSRFGKVSRWRQDEYNVMEVMYDPALIKRIAALSADPELQGRKQQNNIRGLVEVMRFNGSSIDVIRAAAEETDHKHMNRRIQAMRLLSERGTKRDIRLLLNLKGWTNTGNMPPQHVAHSILERKKFESMIHLACRLWRHR